MTGAQRFAVRLAGLLARVEREQWCTPEEAIGVLVGGGAMVAVRERAEHVSEARGRELFVANASRLYDAAEESERAGTPLVKLTS